MKPKILAILPGLIPSTIIGIVKPMLYLDRSNKIDFKMKLSRFCKKGDIEKADIIIFCRNSMAEDLKFIHWAKQLNKKVIYDIDDNFFEISIESQLGRYHRHPVHLYILGQFVKYSNLVRVYSMPMKENIEIFNSRFRITKSYFDFSLLKKNQDKKIKTNDKIKIVYATSRGAEDDTGKIYIQAIKDIANKYQNKVDIYIWGQTSKALKEYRNIHSIGFERDYNRYINKFEELEFDIGLAPLVDDRFNRSKTNNKFREYGALKVAGIYSNVDIYSNCIENNVHGLIVENTYEHWYAAIEELIQDESLRNSIIDNAYNKVKLEYSMESNVEQWEEDIEYVLNQEVSEKDRFYNPQYCKALLVTDIEDNIILKYAIQPLSVGLHFLGIYFVKEKLSEINKELCNDKDVIICFIDLCKTDIIEIEKIKKYGKKLVINLYNIDNMDRVVKICETYPNVQFIINVPLEGMVYPNNLQLINIDDEVIYSQAIDDILYKLMKVHIGINNLQDDNLLIHNVNNYIEQEKECKDKNFHSISSGVVEWLEIFSEIPNKGEVPKKFTLPKFISKPINRIKGFLNRIKAKIEKHVLIIRKVIEYLIVYFKINYLKKY